MFIKSTTIVASTMVALLQSTKASQQRFILLVTAAVATVILWKLYGGLNATSNGQAASCATEIPVTLEKNTSTRWSYDEFAHKLIMENTDLVYAEVGQGFSKGIGKVLTKVTKQLDRKPVIVNL